MPLIAGVGLSGHNKFALVDSLDCTGSTSLPRLHLAPNLHETSLHGKLFALAGVRHGVAKAGKLSRHFATGTLVPKASAGW